MALARVAYLGPAGTFSELAVIERYGEATTREPYATLDDAFSAVASGACDAAVVPIENSTEGAVTRCLDLLRESTLAIVAETSLPIHHQLLVRADGTTTPRLIVAHPQALAQCHRWLATHLPSVERRAVSSNAEGARLASEDGSLAAIASTRAATMFGLRIEAPDIEDEADNRTRFVVVVDGARTALPGPTGHDRTSLVVSVPNRAGAVHELIAPLAEHGVSMTRFESRPARSGGWAYFFYIDVEGHALDPRVASALEAVRARCVFYRLLGAYPRTEEQRG